MDLTIHHTTALENVLNHWDDSERALIADKDPQGDGGFFQRDRIAAGAAWACQNFPGDLVEIGCLNGSTTVRLASVARHFGRRVIAIDPFTPGTQNCSGGEIEIFTQTIAPYADTVDFMRMRSDDISVIRVLEHCELALAFVDGLHEFQACLGDIRAVGHSPVIVVDDTRWSAELRRAVAEAHETREVITRDEWRESWII